jgi:Na+/melibiose symporter-like transporter
MMKAVAPRLLKRFGFRNALAVNGIVAALLYGACAFFRPDWPLPLIFGVLVCCGFSMSFQFTAYNTVAYDRISPARMSSATSFYTTFQQLMLSLGICVAALGLHGSMTIQGHAVPELSDFSAAFAIVVAISLAATVWNLRFAANAGSEISGHGRVAETVKRPAAETSEALEHAR